MTRLAFQNDFSKPSRLTMKKVGIEAALKSGEYLRKKFGHVRTIKYKGRRDLLTEADLNTEMKDKASEVLHGIESSASREEE